MLNTAQWQVYKNIINQAHDSFNQDTIVWHRYIGGFKRYGEDEPESNKSEDIDLKCLIQYNIFRTWPMTKKTPSGTDDKESIVLILNKNYLEGLGYTTTDGFFTMNPGKDLFILHGIGYRPSGETEVAQAGDEPLLFYIVLSRDENETGTDKY